MTGLVFIAETEDKLHVFELQPLCLKETIFVTTCLLSWTVKLFQQGLLGGANFSLLELTLLRKDVKVKTVECSTLKDVLISKKPKPGKGQLK